MPAGRRHLTRYLAYATLALALGATAASAARTPCPPGLYVLDSLAGAALTVMLGAPATSLEVGAAGEISLGGCQAAGRIKAKKKATKVGAKWDACGAASRVRLTAKVPAPACATMSGKVKAKGAGKVAFTATRLGGATTTTVFGLTTSTTTGGTTTTSTTLPIPVFCGNGIVDGSDQCEGHDGCGAGQRCSETCTCAAIPPVPRSSQTLIAAALADGVIDYPTSLVYRAWALFADSRLPPEYDGDAWQWEDTGLFVEIFSTWNNLDAPTQDALRPFTLRPDQVGSYWDGGPASALVPRGGGGELEVHECAYQSGAATPDWRATPTTHFVIWSCGGGDPNQDPDAAKRAIAATVAEAVWSAMTPETDPPKPDQYPPGPPVDERIDVYLVTPRLCKDRDNVCTPIPLAAGKPALGAVAPTAPCDSNGGAAATASGFMLLDSAQVAAAAGGEWPFRHVFAHEFFHLLQNKWNFEGRGGNCLANGLPDPEETVVSWLVESWAEWAAGAYFPDDWRSERARLFRQFQTRDSPIESLRDHVPEPYDAFIYPLFVRHEKGSRAAALEVWKGSGGARTAEQLDARANTDLPFAEHFRDFAVRNFNDTTLPGDPLSLAERHQQVDTAIPPDVRPVIIKPEIQLDFPVERMPQRAALRPLTAEYRTYHVDPNVAYVRIDLNPLTNASLVRADAIVQVDGQWERRRIPGHVFEFCRDDPADDIEAFHLILSNTGWVDGADVSEHFEVTSRFDCPCGWTGSIELVMTLDEY
jgi:hypothetical protein